MKIDVDAIFSWTDWHPLATAGRNADVPRAAGLYRIRRIGTDGLDYVGQTGNSLRGRLGMLGVIYRDEMPYNDPHTAGPGLWALMHANPCDFEASVSPLDGDKGWRLSIEALAVSLYRQQTGASPTLNFGRMPAGYLKSSGNSNALAAAGKRYRGSYLEELLLRHEPSIAPVGNLESDPVSDDWCGHVWSSWVNGTELRRLSRGTGNGLYRVRRLNDDALVYVGQGAILPRLISHVAKVQNPANRLGLLIGGAEQVECSWVANDGWFKSQRLELENDLIASHVLMTGAAPTAQFLG